MTVGKTLPTVTNVSISPSNVVYGTNLTCSYSYSDIDGNADSSTIAWSVNGTNVGSGATLNANVFVGGQTVTCTVTPNDGIGNGTPVSTSKVVGNTAPSVSNVTIAPASPYTDDALTCSYSYADVDGNADASSYSWTVASTSGGAGTVVGTGATLAASKFTRDQYVTCTVTAKDGITTGNSDSDQVQINNSVPSVSSASISPASPTATTTQLTCNYNYSDTDNDSDASAVKWFKNGSQVATGATYAGPYVGGDEVYCRVTANDGTVSGNTITSSTVTVRNTVPTVSNVTITPSSPVYNSNLTCAYTFADVDGDGDDSTVIWEVNGTQVATGTTLTSPVFKGGDEVTCQVTAVDDTGATGNTASKSVTVGNTAPSVSNVTISPSSPATTDALTCSYTYADVDGDTDSSTYTWTVSNSSSGGTVVGTGATLAASKFSRDQYVTCTVTANDGEDTGNSASDQVQIRNTAPVVGGASISPSTPTAATSTLTCNYSYSDADNDSNASVVTWYKNNSQTATGTTYSGPYVGGDEIYCTVQANDGTSNGNSITSATVTVNNTVPTVANVSISPSNIVYGTNLTCSYDFSDLDGNGDNSTVNWSVDGTSVGSGTTLTANVFTGGQTVTCTVTPNDGIGNGTPVSTSKVVGNTAPSISSLTITPTNPYTFDTLLCDYTYSDVDGDSDASIISWTVTDSQTGNTSNAGTGATLFNSNFTETTS